jgi:hypothetical protein
MATATTEAGKNNPANAPAKQLARKNYIPFSTPNKFSDATEIPGYHLHWFLSSNVKRAMAHGYVLVNRDEVDTNNLDIAGDYNDGGSTDLGNHVAIPAFRTGEIDDKLYLMKLPMELWDESVRQLEERNAFVAQSIRGIPNNVEGAYIPKGAHNRENNLFIPRQDRLQK